MTTLPDPAPSSTDNPWLQLILDSNQRDPKNPTAYWNAMQDCISRNFGVVATLDDIETVYERLDKDEVKAFYIRLSKAKMVGKINFKNVIFGKVDFTGARFFWPVSFCSAKFDEPPIFKGVRFLTDADFRKTEFNFHISFEDIEFNGDLQFQEAVFCGGASFHKFVFCRRIFFDAANFHANVFFVNEEGHTLNDRDNQYLSFTKANFSGDIRFENIDFGRICEFNSAKVTGNFNVINCTFQEGLDLQGATICGQTKLKDFDSTLNMRGATFVSHPPALFGSKLKPDSDLACVLPKVSNTNHINIYEDLRQHAEKLGKLDDRKRFVHAELSCRAIDPNKSGAERFVWVLYRLTSNYGTSVYLPLFWLLILFLISAAPWMGYAIWFSPMSVWSALSYNILQAVPFTGHLSSALLNNFHELPMSLHFIAGPIALLNPIFWFLTGLGLRFQLRLAR